MKISVKVILLSTLALGACGSDDVPIPADLSRRAPVLNSAPIDDDPRAVSGGYISAEIPSPIPSVFPPAAPSAFPPIGGGPQAPEPPTFIGSQTIQPFPNMGAQSNVAPQMPTYSPMLPTSSPVDVSAAEASAANLPIQRRAPAFNQDMIGDSPNYAQNVVQVQPVQPLAQVTQIQPQIQAEMPQMPEFSETLQTPQIAFADNDGFPRLSQIPTANPQAPKIDIDSRVQELRSELNARSQPETNFAALQPLPNEPLYKLPEVDQQIQPEYNPMPVAPIAPAYSEPRMPVYQPAPITNTSFQPAAPSNITNLSDLRPIGTSGSQLSLRSSRNYKNIGVARHSTRGGL